MTVPASPMRLHESHTRDGPDDLSDLVVVVPAHQEQDFIAACLRSLAAAAARTAASHPSLRLSVVVVLDACTDGTRPAALDAFGGTAPAWLRLLECSVRCVGAARALGFRDAPVHDRAWYASTDADCVVPPDWVDVQIESARQGNDLFAGTIRVGDWHLRDARVQTQHDATYRFQKGHGYIHGANLGLSALAYHALGGFKALACDEDVGLVSAARAAGYRIDWSDLASVQTSARHSRRTPQGFSKTLSQVELKLAEADARLLNEFLAPTQTGKHSL